MFIQKFYLLRLFTHEKILKNRKKRGRTVNETQFLRIVIPKLIPERLEGIRMDAIKLRVFGIQLYNISSDNRHSVQNAYCSNNGNVI